MCPFLLDHYISYPIDHVPRVNLAKVLFTHKAGQYDRIKVRVLRRVAGQKARDFLGNSMLELSGTKLKVLLLASGDLWGGAEAVVCNLAKGLMDSERIEPIVAVLNEGRLAHICRSHGISTHIVSEAKHSFPGLVQHLGRLIKSLKPHVIHSHGYKENILAFFARGRAKACRLVATLHGLPEGHRTLKSKLAHKANIRVIRQYFEKVVAVSNDIRRTIIQIHDIRPENVVVIRNGIDASKVRPKEWYMRNGSLIIGSAGRFCPVKDFPFMIEIAREVCSRSDNVYFLIAGNGPEKAIVSQKLNDYQLNNKVKLLGHINDMSRYYEGIDLYLNTSRHEGVPVAVLEAMAHGIPVIAPRIGGFPEIIEHKMTGWLVNGRTVESFVQAIMHHVDIGFDNIRKMGNEARKTVVQKFSIDSMTNSYLDLYLSMIYDK